jgi:hypothetical protein
MTTVALVSSIAHFDLAASPSLLMEPFITPTLASATNVDLTAALFEDIGWKIELSVADCGKGSGAVATLLNGLSLACLVFTCANNASNKGQFQGCSKSLALCKAIGHSSRAVALPQQRR